MEKVALKTPKIRQQPHEVTGSMQRAKKKLQMWQDILLEIIIATLISKLVMPVTQKGNPIVYEKV